MTGKTPTQWATMTHTAPFPVPGGVHVQPEVLAQLRGAAVHGALPGGDPGAGPSRAQDREPELRRG